MPDMSGWEVAEKVKKINSKVPVILVTGWNVEIKDAEKIKNYADMVIQKPFEVKKVLQSVQEMMELKEKLKAV